jgi:hypothetical protein
MARGLPHTVAAMKVQVHFLDGEILDGESDAATLQRLGFPVSFPDGNNQIAWVSLAAIKYVIFLGGHFEEGHAEDPRAHQGAVKIVMHFADGETMRSYKDDTFGQEGEGFNLRIWDDKAHALYRVIVSLHALKAIFFVHEWDSRTEEERSRFTEATPTRKELIHDSAQQQIEAMRGEPGQPQQG